MNDNPGETRDDKNLDELVERVFPERLDEPASERLWFRIREQVSTPEPGERHPRFRARWVAVAVAAVTVIAALVISRPHGPVEDRSAELSPRLEQALAVYRAESDRLEQWAARARPEALAGSTDALEALDAAIAELRRALVEAPRHPETAERLLSYARWRHELLTAVARSRSDHEGSPEGGAG